LLSSWISAYTGWPYGPKVKHIVDDLLSAAFAELEHPTREVGDQVIPREVTYVFPDNGTMTLGAGPFGGIGVDITAPYPDTDGPVVWDTIVINKQ
jgi:hypothetical protein